MQESLAPDANWMNRQGMLVPIKEYGIDVRTSTRVLEVKGGKTNVDGETVEDSGVIVKTPNGNEEFIKADTILCALGMKATNPAQTAFDDCAYTVIAVGDSSRPRQVEQAVYEGIFAALDL